MSDCARRKLKAGAEARIATAGGVRSWPVKIAVHRTDTAFGITTAHHHATGSDVAFILVGKPLSIADRVIETPGGPVLIAGIASAVLTTVAEANTNIRKVA